LPFVGPVNISMFFYYCCCPYISCFSYLIRQACKYRHRLVLAVIVLLLVFLKDGASTRAGSNNSPHYSSTIWRVRELEAFLFDQLQFMPIELLHATLSPRKKWDSPCLALNLTASLAQHLLWSLAPASWSLQYLF
jgi:hypothetical protein